ncbi:MAG TPA: methyltransferase domain-containing protein [Acidimicrobiales bacterium]|nr:methyltransferase domain-containing protein [Acidimicrobiales bacterium]
MADGAGTTEYALELSESERNRYRMMAAVAVQEEASLWRAAGVVEGAAVADVGCGPGAVLVELARLVGPTGRAAGVEPGAAARAAAREELDSAGFTAEAVPVLASSAEATGLEPGEWDCVMVRHVLIHTGDAPSRIVSHLASLLRPGGHLYLVDTDLGALRTTPADEEMEEQQRRYEAFHRSLGNDPHMGPRLPALLADAGLAVTERVGRWLAVPAVLARSGGPLQAAQDAMIAAGHLDAGELDRWQAARLRFAEVPEALVWVPFFVAVGRRL